MLACASSREATAPRFAPGGPATERTPTLAEALGEYLLSWQVEGHSPESCRARRYLLAPVRRAADGRGVHDLTREFCIDLILERRRCVQPSSVRTFVQGLSAFATFCLEQGWISAHPMRGIKRPKAPPKPHRYLSARQCAALYQACRDDYERLALRLMGECGLRIGEVVGLRWDRVGWESGTLELLGKGPKWRAVDAGASLVLLARLPHHGALIWPMTAGSLRRRVIRLGRDVGLSWQLRPHELRHTFSVAFLEASEEDAFTLQQILGHNDPEMTAHYVRAVRERAAVRKMRRVGLRLFGEQQ